MTPNLEKLFREATPVPWTHFTDRTIDLSRPHMKFIVGSNGQGLAHSVGMHDPQDAANVQLICLLATHGRALIEALKQQRAVLAELQDVGFSCTALAAWTRLGQLDTRAKHLLATLEREATP